MYAIAFFLGYFATGETKEGKNNAHSRDATRQSIINSDSCLVVIFSSISMSLQFFITAQRMELGENVYLFTYLKVKMYPFP